MSSPLNLPFAQAVQAIRQEWLSQGAPSGALGVRLRDTLQMKEAQLALALVQAYGVALLTPTDMAGFRLTRLIHVGGRALRLGQTGQGTVLIADDPWAESVAQTLIALPNAQTQLALLGFDEQRVDGDDESALAHQANQAHSPEVAVSGDGFSVIDFVDRVIAEAYRERASDIHFETLRSGVQVKLRLDGVMTPHQRVEDPLRAEQILSRIKVMALLDITERRRPQDGRIRWIKPNGESLDLRVSVMPSIHGEDAVLRLLDKSQLWRQGEPVVLTSLGFGEASAAAIRRLAQKPHGMLLVTGPTGSGKTTTVYAAMTESSTGLEKTITIEDPVEYELPGVLQIPVNEKKGLTFATGLRSILRHDPDKILVGEIRDAETAQIAVQSALTGHLVFTTVHANSLVDVLGRFQHFAIDPFSLASALNGVLVQRLLRRVCPHCASRVELTPYQLGLYQAAGVPAPKQIPKVMGCTVCRSTGYKGRLVIAEVHTLNDQVRDLLIQRATLTHLKEAVYANPESSLLSQALQLIARGETTFEEVDRVVGLAQ